MPAELVEAVKANLSPELQWMAPALAASLGCTALVGASEAAAYLYELKAADGTIEANWQALQAIMAGGSQYAVELVAGKYWRRALLYVPIGNQVTVTIGGVTQPLLLGSAQPHVIDIYDEPGVAWPTSITFQRTSGSDATGWFSVLG